MAGCTTMRTAFLPPCEAPLAGSSLREEVEERVDSSPLGMRVPELMSVTGTTGRPAFTATEKAPFCSQRGKKGGGMRGVIGRGVGAMEQLCVGG